MKHLICTLGLCALALPALAQDGTASFINTEGTATGTATLTAAPGGVLIRIEVEALPASQWLGFHIHETGTCDHETGHESAGGHFNPAGADHGVLAENGPHAGDMPNIRTDADGFARAEVFNPWVTLAEGESSIRGRALMIHAGADDYHSQPTGGAGDRLACAVIE
ncbi:superoxide dismutase family protein [Pseudogemmobacter humi]|uniref:Superoxide dismutase [Cu-Zn] n=1 Tax=Pseudogemmobacter humi TaxID=2483812 RepID=A0A3P5X1P9_9RHOB|nr:superoxide dismutase family protein [Pseudogemmobacter humi]VDC25141.1 Superoxide dismutase [Cu-Zn] precursor [Pseudogemmobacter humi]